MKTTLIRLFALAMLASSIPGFAARTPAKDEKTNTPCTPAQDASGQSKDSNMMQSKEDHMMQSKEGSMMKDTKNTKKKLKKDKMQNPKQNKEDKYDPLQGIWG
jgi:hypothetical protein